MAAAKKPVEKKEEVKVVDNTIKYRHDFKSWEDYNKYTGKKG